MSESQSNIPDKDEVSGADALAYATTYHAPVLCDVVVQGLVTNRDGIYVDATLGGGGHSAALLDYLGKDGRVIGIDQDADAIQAARKRLAEAERQEKFLALRGNFSEAPALLAEAGIDRVDGMLLDLGVSSFQLNTAERGFSYARDGELDMRMDGRKGITAAEIVNEWPPADLIRLLRVYGEEPKASRIVRKIVAARPLTTTGQLADTVRSSVSGNKTNKTLARVFQALRIYVNDEVEVLEKVLQISVDLVKPGGRIAVISYHSLEDRRVKRFLKYGNLEGKPVQDFYGNLITPWHLVTRKAIKPDDEEISLNPRARSARLRIAERIQSEGGESVV